MTTTMTVQSQDTSPQQPEVLTRYGKKQAGKFVTLEIELLLKGGPVEIQVDEE